MKAGLIVLFGIVAVATGFTIEDRQLSGELERYRRASGFSLDALKANAGGVGENIKTNSALLSQEGSRGNKDAALASSSAQKGIALVSSVLVKAKGINTENSKKNLLKV